MRLGINIVPFFPGKIGGAEQYIRNIISGLENKEDIQLYLFLNKYALPTFKETEKVKLVEINLAIPHALQLNHYIEYYAIDVWFCPLFHLIPEKCAIPSVVSIFDIQQEYYPEYFDKFELEMRKRQTANTVKVADKILTISEFSKSTLLEKYDINADKIIVTHLDADSCFNNEITEDKLKKIKSRLPEDYILYPANSWPHKNHIKLLEAFHILKQKYRLPLKLVFTGSHNKEKPKIENFIIRHGLKDDIKYLGYIPQEDMPYVFAGASMIAFPSLFEGFGIPLVEAMKSGVPIACSTFGSIPEVAGNAALYFDALNPNDIAEKLYMLYTDKELRISLIEKGNVQKKKFSWDKCVNDTIDIISSLYTPPKIKEMFLREEYPLVSIITPSYNQGEFIRETIESVLSQDYPNIEYIVMDGGSTDQTLEILKEYGDRIKWFSEKDEGQADAVNKGIRMAKGEIIGWLNSDDTYCPGAIRKVVEYFRTHPKVDMVYGEGYYTDKNSVVTDRYLTSLFDYDALASNCFICQPAAFFTKEIVEKVGLLDKNLQLCMDYELWMKIGKVGKIAYIPDFLATSRMYEENKTLSKRKEVYKEVCKTVKKYYGYTPHTWIYGYAHHINNGKHGLIFKITYLLLFIRYNCFSFGYLKRCFHKALKRFLPQGTSSENNTFKGQYADGWLSDIYETEQSLKAEAKQIIIEGQHLLPMEKPLEIKVVIDEKDQASITVSGSGSFRKELELREPLKEGSHFIQLFMNQTYNPKKAKKSADSRNLSFMLKKIDFQ